MFRSILVALDGSRHAERALGEAIDLARVSHAGLTVMTVVPDPALWLLSVGYGATADLDRLCGEMEHEYVTMLRAAVERVPDDVAVTSVVKNGAAARAILQQIRDGGHDLVVMGSRGRGDLQSLVLGSVSHRVLHDSPVAVLILRAEGHGDGTA